MARSIPDCPQRPEESGSSKDYECRTFTVQVVTPMFGGGVEPGEPDPVTLIRPTTIRGHLRFWWRATRGAAFETVRALKEREGNIWGNTEKPSKVVVTVRLTDPGKPRRCAEYRWDDRAHGGQGGHRLRWDERFRDPELPYALFPFQGQPPKSHRDRRAEPEKRPSHMVVGTAFQLTLRYPRSLKDDVESSVSAWLNFGGIGARTRRGCGSLFCADCAPKAASIDALRTWIAGQFPKIGQGTTSGRIWPSLFNALLVGSQQDVFRAWRDAIALLQKFRQGVNTGRNPGQQQNRPGRSRWPEPETIREVTRKRCPRHEPLAHHPTGIPRAQFGLPIVFHFKDERQGDPSDTQLYPIVAGEATGRMASPLILKPLAISTNQAVAIVLRLESDCLEGAVLKEKQNTQEVEIRRFKREDICNDRFGEYPNSPMKEFENALDAFLAFAKTNGFQEVGS